MSIKKGLPDRLSQTALRGRIHRADPRGHPQPGVGAEKLRPFFARLIFNLCDLSVGASILEVGRHAHIQDGLLDLISVET